MKRIVPPIVTAMMVMSFTAVAQTSPVPPATPAIAAAPVAGQGNGGSLEATLAANLQQSGFTDVKVMPDAFLVQAKDRAGNPVTMFLRPDSMTVLAGRPSGEPVASPVGAPAGGSTVPAIASSMFMTIPAKDDLSSKVVGLNIYNSANQDIGKIKDVAFNATGVKAYIVGVGGFLGMGDRYVAVRASAVTLSYDAAAKQWHAALNATAEALKAAPEYKYAANY